MSVVSSTFEAHQPVHSEERAISLSWKNCHTNPRLARNHFQVRNSVRPMHLFGHNLDHDYYFELPSEGERDTQSELRWSRLPHSVSDEYQPYQSPFRFLNL